MEPRRFGVDGVVEGDHTVLPAGDLRRSVHHDGGLLRRVRRRLVSLGPERNTAGEGSWVSTGAGQPAHQRNRNLCLPHIHKDGGARTNSTDEPYPRPYGRPNNSVVLFSIP